MVSLPSEFRASLDSYSGPLDLLLFLIKKDEIDVFDIPIAGLVGQYQVYLELLRDVDPNVCGDFLVMAARLMEIKSKLLLPREVLEEGDEEFEDPRIELVRQLLEYKKFKERALLLERQLDTHRRRFRRPRMDIGDRDVEDAPLHLGNIGVWDLLTAFHRIQIALGARVPHQVVMEDRPLSEYMDDVVGRLARSDSRTTEFDDLFASVQSRVEAVSYFLAILELAKVYRITIHQDLVADQILVTLRSDEEFERIQSIERALEAEPEFSPDEEEELARASESLAAYLDDEGADDEGADDEGADDEGADDEGADDGRRRRRGRRRRVGTRRRRCDVGRPRELGRAVGPRRRCRRGSDRGFGERRFRR